MPALAALAAAREALRCGRGEDVDVAILDCMAVTMTTYPSVFASFFGWPPLAGTGRSIQLPSIEPSSDGCVVFTANSAQQFQDFLVLMERPDLLDDHELAMVGKRFARRAEFIDAVRAYTRTRTSAELLDAAAAFRIPAAPVLDAPGVLAFEHFTDRDVFVPSPSGRFAQPRVPYRIDGFAPRPFTAAPARGADDGAIEWAGEAVPDTAPDDEWRLPLHGVKVVDLTAWWAGPAATNVLAALGADVVKVESVARPDQMRLSGTRHPPADAWWEWGPIFHAANLSKRDVTLDLNSPDGLALLHRLIDSADVLVENFTPRVIDHFGLDFESLRARNPRLVMVRMPSFGLNGPWRDRTGFAQTMEAVSGLAWRTGYEDELPMLVLGACDPIAGAHAVFATLLALRAREDTGEGMLVESVMVESALNVAAEAIVEYGAGAPALGRRGNRGPDAAPQGVYPGSTTDSWVALAIETDAQWDALVTAVGSPAWSGRPRAAHRRRPAHPPRHARQAPRGMDERTYGRGSGLVALGRRRARRGGHRSAGRDPQSPTAGARHLRERGPPGHRVPSGAHPAVPVRPRGRVAACPVSHARPAQRRGARRARRGCRRARRAAGTPRHRRAAGRGLT